MIRFEVTRNRRLIEDVVKNRYVWPSIIDDSLIDPDLFIAPIDDRQFTWLVVYDDNCLLGMFMAERCNLVTYEVHTMLLRPAYGRSVDIGKGALLWAFYNLDNCKRIITEVPSFNSLADKLCRSLNLEFIGVNKLSYQLNGILYDTKWYGVSKEDFICQQSQQ